ncbi:MAG: SPOR domain-containing protein [Flavipsychrobacter sp.]
MKHSLYILLLLFSILYTNISVAQTVSNTSDIVEEDVPKKFGNITLHVDNRVDLLLERHKTFQTGIPYSGRGFRVQIYYGGDRDEARNTKLDFMRRHPETRVYLTYIAPQYRVKVGNFATHKEAWDFYREINSEYSRCMVVPDNITINKKSDD